MVACLGVLVGAVIAASAVSLLPRPQTVVDGAPGTTYDAVPDHVVEVSTRQFGFHPGAVTVPVGKLVEVRVTNEDAFLHTFTYENAGVTYHHDLPGRSTTSFVVYFREPTTASLWCVPHVPGMVGQIVAE